MGRTTTTNCDACNQPVATGEDDSLQRPIGEGWWALGYNVIGCGPRNGESGRVELCIPCLHSGPLPVVLAKVAAREIVKSR